MSESSKKLRVAIIATGEAYQEAAAWAACTFARPAADVDEVSVLLPEQETEMEALKARASSFCFSLQKFPFRPISEKKFTSQLKCQACLFAVSQLNEGDLLFLVDADACCLKRLAVPLEMESAIKEGKIGLAQDIADHHSRNPADPWYLPPAERLPYVNSGVIVASRRALGLFERFCELSRQEGFLRGPFNDQKVINFALGKYFRDKLLLLDKSFNDIGRVFSKQTIIAHFAGGAGYLAKQPRKRAHQTACAELVRGAEIPLTAAPG